jgi:hypothetical protein
MDENILLKPCDLGQCDYHEPYRFSFTTRGKEPVGHRHGIPPGEHTRLRMLQKDDIKRIVGELASLIADGYSMREVRAALGVKAS